MIYTVGYGQSGYPEGFFDFLNLISVIHSDLIKFIQLILKTFDLFKCIFKPLRIGKRVFDVLQDRLCHFRLWDILILIPNKTIICPSKFSDLGISLRYNVLLCRNLLFLSKDFDFLKMYLALLPSYGRLMLIS